MNKQEFGKRLIGEDSLQYRAIYNKETDTYSSTSGEVSGETVREWLSYCMGVFKESYGIIYVGK